MQKLFQKFSILFLSIIIFIFSCLVLLYFYNKINLYNNESQSVEEKWQMEVARRNEIKMLDHSIKIIEPERAQLETHFAKSSDVVPFLDTIEGLAREAGTEAEITAVSIPADNSGLLVEMKSSGTFGNLYKFLELLENSPYELEFIAVSMQKKEETSSLDIGIPEWEEFLKLKLLSFIQ